MPELEQEPEQELAAEQELVAVLEPAPGQVAEQVQAVQQEVF